MMKPFATLFVGPLVAASLATPAVAETAMEAALTAGAEHMTADDIVERLAGNTVTFEFASTGDKFLIYYDGDNGFVMRKVDSDAVMEGFYAVSVADHLCLGMKADEPIRLTSDPAWGDGPGLILGSERVTGWTRGSQHPDIPEAAEVWTTEVPFKARALWLVEPDGTAVRIPIARHPNWTPEPEDAKAGWWEWDNPGKPFGHTHGKRHLGIDTVNVPQHPKAFFEDAVIWPEFGWVMGGPYPTKVEHVDLERKGLAFAGWTGGTAGVIFRHQRYYLEAKPHYLDDPDGEFWFEQRGDGERLHLRLPDGVDPNAVRIEAGARGNMIRGEGLRHIEVSRLVFRFNNERHDYWNVPLDWSTKPPKSRPDNNTACVSFGESIDIRVAGCRFRNVMAGIRLSAGKTAIDDLVVSDNLIEYCDAMAIAVSGGAGWGLATREGELRPRHQRS